MSDPWSLHAPEFDLMLKNAGFISPSNELEVSGSLLRYRSVVSLGQDYILQSGGLLRAVSRKSAEMLRSELSGLSITRYSDEIMARWRYILLHCQPHLDEYISSLLLRACLPDEMHRLIVDETVLYYRFDDKEAQYLWPSSAVLGVGNSANGGAEPLLLFDEHIPNGSQAKQTSLAMTMKRNLLGKQHPPNALYEMLREVNYIDQFGSSHPKSLAVYIKHMQSVLLPTASGLTMSPEWKCAALDAYLAAYLYAIKSDSMPFETKSYWEPALKLSLGDFASRTALREYPEFQSSFHKVQNYLTNRFAYNAQRNGLCYYIPNANKPTKTSSAKYHLLVPYLPYVMFRVWGGALGQCLLMPLWEGRILHDMMFSRTCAKVSENMSFDGEGVCSIPEVGEIDVRMTKRFCVDGVSATVLDVTPINQMIPASAFNHVLKKIAGGVGFTIFRNPDTNSIVLTKGSNISQEVWERLCRELLELEGSSDNCECCGAWHESRSINGLAPFLLNGNPTHRYAPSSRITAGMVVDMLDSCCAAEK